MALIPIAIGIITGIALLFTLTKDSKKTDTKQAQDINKDSKEAGKLSEEKM